MKYSRLFVYLHQRSPSVTMADSSNVNCDFSDATHSDYAEIVMVRHGETAWNADGRFQGHLDVELNDVGRKQAAIVADRLSKEMAISALYSSDLKRASETANTIANRCGVVEVITDPDLRERHLGDLQGLQLKEAAKLKPDDYVAYSSSRTDQEITVLGEQVVVVTHGGVVRAFHKRSASEEKLPGKILNASVNKFHLADEKWVLKAWGDISHLSESGYLETASGGDRTSG